MSIILVNITMKINEVFDKPYEWHWEDLRGRPHKMLSVKTAAVTGGDIETAINPDRPSKFSASSGQLAATFDVDDDIIWVTFNRGRTGHWFVSFDSQTNRMKHDKDYVNTNSGHAGKVLATVIEIVKDFINHYNPTAIHFTANDNKRASIYKAIVNRIGKYNKFKPHIQQTNKATAFALER